MSCHNCPKGPSVMLVLPRWSNCTNHWRNSGVGRCFGMGGLKGFVFCGL